MNIEKRGNSYRVRVYIDGKRKSFTFDHKPTKKEIDKIISAETVNHVKAKDAPTTIFEECANEYVRIKGNVISASTIRGYKSIIKNIPDDFKQLQLKDIDRLVVQKVINDYSQTHSPKSTKNLHGFIAAVLSMFYPDLKLNTTLPQKVKTKDDYIPTKEDLNRIFELVSGTQYYIPYKLGAHGLRRSEILALKWPDDFEGNICHINKAMVEDENHNWVIKSTKTTESARDIWLEDSLIEEIKKQGYIYKQYPGTLTKHLYRCQEKLGLPHFRFHDLRHFFATELSQVLSEEDILKMGGWASPYTMKRVYRHNRISDDMEKQKNIMENLFKDN